MIAEAVEFIRKEVRIHLGIADGDVVTDSAHILATDPAKSGLYISLVNLQEEAALKNTPHVERRGGKSQYIEPPVYLNLYLLFAFKFGNYGTSLTHLSQTIELFQSKRWFSAETQTVVGANANPFPAGLEKLLFEMDNMNFEEHYNLWGVLGGTYLPSVVYKVRLVKVQLDSTTAAPEITTIGLDTVVS